MKLVLQFLQSTTRDNAMRQLGPLIHPFTDHFKHIKIGPTIIERGEGIYVYDRHGKQYIEGISGLWCAALGFSDPELRDAAWHQLGKLPSYHAGIHKCTPPLIDLAEKLLDTAPSQYKSVFFVNSGSEATETALKLLYYRADLRGVDAPVFLSRRQAYHGMTLGAASLNGISSSHAGFGLPIIDVRYAACPSQFWNGREGESEARFTDRLIDEIAELIEKAGAPRIAGMFVEPVMGAGGVVVPPDMYLASLSALLRDKDIPIVADEVICGLGRLSEMWAAPAMRLDGNLMTCAKALGAAYCPIGAVLVDEQLCEVLVEQNRRRGVFSHGFTFGGHPVSAAIALETLRIFERRDLIAHAKAMELVFQRKMSQISGRPFVGEVRGKGMLHAFEFTAKQGIAEPLRASTPAGTYMAERAEEYGLILRAVGNTIVLCPPIIIAEDEIEELFKRLGRALDDTEAWIGQQP
jgi:4-aminobutyrate--pyruvate transaminase